MVVIALKRREEHLAARRSRSTQPAIEVEDTVVGKPVGRQKQCGIGNLGGLCYSIERRVFQEGLLDFWLEI
jgi:hypothetical protein